MIDQRILHNQGIKVDELRLPAAFANSAAVERRRDAALALDPLVRRALAAAIPGLAAATVDVTLYDSVYPAYPEAGAHWTAASLLLGMLTHAVWSYTVTLHFDELDQPQRFVVQAAQNVVTKDVSEAALRDAIERARVLGPLRTYSANVFASTGI
jgi:hypothetical protein